MLSIDIKFSLCYVINRKSLYISQLNDKQTNYNTLVPPNEECDSTLPSEWSRARFMFSNYLRISGVTINFRT